MKVTATRSHLSCTANNLGWAKDADRQNALPADCCPSRERILQAFGTDSTIESLLCDCEQACVQMREAFNRRCLGELVIASQERTICREKLANALNRYTQALPAWQPAG